MATIFNCYFKIIIPVFLLFILEINHRLGTPAPNGKDGANGLRVQLLVERGLKSGLELVLEVLGHVQERPQRPKIAFW